MPRSLMTQAWAGGQTDIFSEEKLLWGPPFGTSLPPTARRGGLGTEPWGVGLCTRELGHNVPHPPPRPVRQSTPIHWGTQLTRHGQTGSWRGEVELPTGPPRVRAGLRPGAFAMQRTHTQDHTHGTPGHCGHAFPYSAASGALWRTLGSCCRIPCPRWSVLRSPGPQSRVCHLPNTLRKDPAGFPVWRLSLCPFSFFESRAVFMRPRIPMGGCQGPRASEFPSLFINS